MRGMATVLCVDDSVVIRVMLKFELERCGYTVLVAKNGPDALITAQQHHVAAVILDYDMPKMNGAKLAAELKSRHPKVKIMMLTGFDLGAVEDSSSFDKVLGKGAGPERICDELEKMLETGGEAPVTS